MFYKAAVFLFFVLPALNLYAQKKLNGIYDALDHEFFCADPNVLVKPFTGNRAAFMLKGSDPFDYKKNKVGFIDTNGKVVIKPVYANASNFWRGFALVQDALRRQALINTEGKIIIPFAKQGIAPCENALFVKIDYTPPKTISIVDKNNHTIVPFGKYAVFATPPVRVSIVENEPEVTPGRNYVWDQPYFSLVHFNTYIGVKTGIKKDDKWAVINAAGKEIIPPKFDWIGIFDHGIAPFSIKQKFGITDTTGREIIPPLYDKIELSGPGFAIVTQHNKSGVLSINNKVLIPLKYNSIFRMATGAFLADTANQYTTKFGVINSVGDIIIPVDNVQITAFGTGYLVYKYNNSMALFDSAGIRKTDFGSGYALNYPVWQMGGHKGFMVYNERKRDFTHYDEINDLMYKAADKWGLLDSAGAEVTKPQFDEFWYTPTKKAIAVKQNGKWYFIDNRGKKMTDDEYDEITSEGDGWFFKVKKDGKYGLLYDFLKLMLPIKYDRIASQDGYGTSATISVVIDKKAGLVDGFGREIIQAKYDEIAPLNKGFFEVMINQKWGLLNAAGHQVVPCIYDSMQRGQFSLLMVSQNKRYGLINYRGKVILPLVCNTIVEERLYGRPVYIMTRNGKTGMADTSGKQFLPFRYDYAYALNPYAYKLTDGLLVRNSGLYGVASLSGKIIVPTVYDQVVAVSGTSKRCYEVVCDKKLGIADETGKLIIPCIYTYLAGITDRSMLASKGGPIGVIDWNQNIILPFIYDNIEPCSGGYIVRLNGKSGATNLKGDEIIPVIYDNIYKYEQNIFLLSKNRKVGLADSTGKMLLPIIYDNISTCGTKSLLLKKDNLMGLIDYTGKVIYPCKYTYINCVDGKVVEIY